MATVIAAPAGEQRLVIGAIDWKTYVAMGDLLQDRHIFLTYSRGALEIMTVGPEHEHAKKTIARLLEALTVELDIDVVGFGSMTMRREDLDEGMEPDECFWIAHEPAVRGRTDIDLASDPPPDLVIEIEITRNIINRLPLLAALGVPEVWRWNGQCLQVLLLGLSGQYAPSPASKAFPFLPMADFVRFLAPDAAETETKRIKAFQGWVRQASAGWRKS